MSDFLGEEDVVRGVGRTADPEGIADHLVAGNAVVLVGPVGAGKTVTMRRVAHALAQREVPTRLIRGVELVHAAGSPAMEEPPPAGTTLLVDDAHALDERSASTLIQAVCRRRVAACIAVEMPMFSRPASDEVTSTLLELGSRGFALRIDIEPLSETEASAFLRECGVDGLDDVTRDAIVWMANGSRALLYEFAEVASDADRHGRDPLVALREAPVWTRQADAIHKHLSTLDVEHLSTLAAVGRFRGIASSHAARIRPSREIDALRAHGYVFRDDSDAGALWANPLLAAAAERALGEERVAGIVDAATSRMFAARGRWWSPPIATAVAEALLRGAPPPAEGSDDLCRRALRDAARQSNDQGHFAAAEAFASTGISEESDDVGLHLERTHAMVSAGHSPAGHLVPADLSASDDRLRALHIMTAWEMRGFAASARDLRTVLEDGPEVGSDPDLASTRIDALGFSLQWGLARDTAEETARTTTGPRRVWAWLREAYARGQLGDAEGAGRLLARIEESVYESGVSGLGTPERLRVLIVSLVTHLVMGHDAPPLHDRIARERRLAALEGDDRALGIAGLAAALSAAARGEADSALRNLEAARTRFPLLRTDMAAASVKLVIAQFLAGRGRAREARRIVERVSSLWTDGPLSLRHDCLAAKSMVDAMDQRYDDAARSIQHALELTARRQAPMIRARDLYRGMMLGVVGHNALDEVERLLPATAITLRAAFAEPPPSVEGGAGPTQLRDAFLRTLLPGPSSAATADPPVVRGEAPAVAAVLTRREAEIAGLIARGMSNREIAAHLFLSVRTVESHIYQARAKTGADSRRDLGRRVAGETTGR